MVSVVSSEPSQRLFSIADNYQVLNDLDRLWLRIDDSGRSLTFLSFRSSG